MVLGWMCWAPAALAADPGLLVERGLVLASQSRYQEAREQALAALKEAPADPSAQQLYLDASAGAGLGPRAVAELSDSERAEPDHAASATALADAVANDDVKAIKAAIKGLLASHPEHPELLEPLWSGSKKATRFGRKAALRLSASKRLEAATVPAVYRLRRIVVDHLEPTILMDSAVRRADPLVAIDDELARRSETLPPPRPPLNLVEQTQLASALVREETPELPAFYPAEQVAVAKRLGGLLAQGRRFADSAAMYRSVQPNGR